MEDCDKVIVAGQHLDQTQAPAVIPDHMYWLVTMWHFDADASIEYSGEKFSASWETGQNEIIRAYSKEFNVAADKHGTRTSNKGMTRVRVEV